MHDARLVSRVFRELLPLSPYGNRLRGKSPSCPSPALKFFADPAKGVWYDFATGKAGDLADLAAQVMRISRKQAEDWARTKCQPRPLSANPAQLFEDWLDLAQGEMETDTGRLASGWLKRLGSGDPGELGIGVFRNSGPTPSTLLLGRGHSAENAARFAADEGRGRLIIPTSDKRAAIAFRIPGVDGGGDPWLAILAPGAEADLLLFDGAGDDVLLAIDAEEALSAILCRRRVALPAHGVLTNAAIHRLAALSLPVSTAAVNAPLLCARLEHGIPIRTPAGDDALDALLRNALCDGHETKRWKAVLPMISHARSQADRDMALTLASTISGLESRDIRTDLEIGTERREHMGMGTLEEALLCIIIHAPFLAPEAAEATDPTWIDKETTAGRLLACVFGECWFGDWDGLPSLTGAMSSRDEVVLVSALHAVPKHGDPKGAARATIEAMRKRSLRAKLDALIESQKGEKDVARSLDTQRQIRDLRLELAGRR